MENSSKRRYFLPLHAFHIIALRPPSTTIIRPSLLSSASPTCINFDVPHTSSVIYQQATSDPNQMKPKDFVECKKPNYYLLRDTMGRSPESSGLNEIRLFRLERSFESPTAHVRSGSQYLPRSRNKCRSLKPLRRAPPAVPTRIGVQLRRRGKRGERFNEAPELPTPSVPCRNTIEGIEQICDGLQGQVSGSRAI